MAVGRIILTPVNQQNNPIEAFAWRDATHVYISLDSAATGHTFTSDARLARLASDNNGCFIEIGQSATVTATGTGIFLPPNSVEYVALYGGETISAIQSSAAAILSVLEF